MECEGTKCYALPSSQASKSIEKEAESFLQRLNKNVIEPESVNIDPNEYRNRYESLLGAIKLAYYHESCLLQQNQALLMDKANTNAELQSSLRSKEETQSYVSILRSDLNKVNALLENSNSREEKANSTIQQIQNEIKILTDRNDKSEASISRKDDEMKRHANDVEYWKEHANSNAEKIEAMKIEEQRVMSHMDQLQILYNDCRDSNELLKVCISERDTEGRRVKERLEKEREETQTKFEAKTAEFIDMQSLYSVAQSKSDKMEKDLVESKKANAMIDKELKELLLRKVNMVALLDDQKKKCSALSAEMNEMEQDKKKSSLERNRLNSEKTQLERNLESERRALFRHQQLVEDANAATRLSNNEVQSLEKEIDVLKKREDQFKTDILTLKRENGLQICRIQMKEDKMKKTGHDLRHNEGVIASLEKELANAKDAMAKQLSFTQRLEVENDGLRHQVTEARSSYQRIIDEMKIREKQANDLTRTIEELQGLIEDGNQKHDVNRVDLNNSLKLLREGQSEVENLKIEIKSRQREIETLQSEVVTKDSALTKAHHDYRKEKAQNEFYVGEISRLKRAISERENTMQTIQSEVRHLNTSIRKLDDNALIKSKEYNQIINERDILGTQLIRRNDELALLHEKIKLLQGTLGRGELQYNTRVEDIRLLKIKLKDIQRHLTIARSGQPDLEALKRNLLMVEKELIHERVKVRALSDELENPMNIHRWRKLEGTDPTAHEMIQKIQILQKRLLLNTEEVMTKNNIIERQQQQQAGMEKALARAPGPEISTELLAYQNDVRKKSKQMKAMASELNMHQAQVNEYKREIDRLATELNSFKRKYFEHKRRDAEAKEKESELISEVDSVIVRSTNDQSNSTKRRFVGGGFAIK